MEHIMTDTKRVECCLDDSRHGLRYYQVEDYVKRFRQLNYPDYTPAIWTSIVNDEIDQLRHDNQSDEVFANYDHPSVKRVVDSAEHVLETCKVIHHHRSSQF